MQKLLAPERGFWVLFSFIGFFAVVIGVNAIFITQALRTHSGVITDKPYEKGLEFDSMAEVAATQPEITEEFVYKDGTLYWSLSDEAGEPIKNARITARLVRPVKSGYDTDVELLETTPGIYKASPALPYKGYWKTTLKAEWNNQSYRTRAEFIAK